MGPADIHFVRRIEQEYEADYSDNDVDTHCFTFSKLCSPTYEPICSKRTPSLKQG